MLAGIFIALIVVANLALAAVGPGWSWAIALACIGPDLTIRDALHDRLGESRILKMAGLVAVGALITWALSGDHGGRVGIASAVAFLVAGLADTWTYELASGSRRERMLISNVAGALADSAVFFPIAFGVLTADAGLQVIAKIAGGALAVLFIRGRRG